jgi:hypothetical protein
MSRFPYFLDNRLTDGGEVVKLRRRPPLPFRKIPGIHFCYRLSRTQGHRRLELAIFRLVERYPNQIRYHVSPHHSVGDSQRESTGSKEYQYRKL